MSLVVLSDGIVTLRPHTPKDVDSLYSAVLESVPEVSLWLPWCHAAYTRAEAEHFIGSAQKAWEPESDYPFAILDAADGVLLGGIGINHIDRSNRLANVGYWVRSSKTGRGVATAAARLVAAHAFGHLGLTRLEIVCIADNHASRRVAEKVGAKFEAISRNRLVKHGQAHDAALYGLIPDDMPADSARSQP